MDSNHPPLEDLKKQVYFDLSECLINAVENRLISDEESKNSSAYILENLDKANSKQEILAFLKSLANLWETYRQVYLKMYAGELKEEDNKKINNLMSQVQNI